MSSWGNETKCGFHVLSLLFPLTRTVDFPKEKSLLIHSRILSERPITVSWPAVHSHLPILFSGKHTLSSRDPIRTFMLLWDGLGITMAVLQTSMRILTWWFRSSSANIYREIIIVTVRKCLRKARSQGLLSGVGNARQKILPETHLGKLIFDSASQL